jgi:hypothetical protein
MSIEGKDIANLFRKFTVPTIAVILAISSLIVYYFRSDLSVESNAKFEQSTAQLKRLRDNISAASQLDDQLSVLENANKRLGKTAMRLTELAKNTQIFYNLEKEIGFKLVDVSQLVKSAPNKSSNDIYIVIPFDVTVEGDFKQIMMFLKRLEYAEQVTRIKTASISPAQGTTLSLSLTIDFIGLR